MGKFAEEYTGVKGVFSRGESATTNKGENEDKVRFIPEKGEYTIHFADDELWLKFWQHYIKAKKRYITCLGERVAPKDSRGKECVVCFPELANENAEILDIVNKIKNRKPASAALTYIFDEAGKPKVWKLNYSVINKVEPYVYKYGTLVDRDYNLIVREAKDKIEYSVLPDEKRKLNEDELAELKTFVANNPLDRHKPASTQAKINKLFEVKQEVDKASNKEDNKVQQAKVTESKAVEVEEEDEDDLFKIKD